MSAIADGVDFFLNILSFDNASKPKASRPAIVNSISFSFEQSILDRIDRWKSSTKNCADDADVRTYLKKLGLVLRATINDDPSSFS